MSKQKYNLNKFARITLSHGIEPEEYLKQKLSLNWPVARIFMDLKMLSRKYQCDMVNRKTLISWIKKVQEQEAA